MKAPARRRADAPPPNSPRALMLADLARSGLDESDAKRMRCVPLTPAETMALTGRAVPSYRIPYPDPAGDDTEFFRVRYLAEVRDRDGDEVRYWQPPDSVPHPYFPPTLKWSKVMRDASVAVTFTEGEKKAMKAAREGVVCVGLGGVWNYQSKDANIQFLSELGLFDWAGRAVETAYDGGDAEINRAVRLARERLEERLEARGALVAAVRLPMGVKLDDYLVDHSREEYAALPRDGAGGWSPPAVATYGAAFDPAAIPRREWVIAGRYARGEGTAVVGPPGTNKSTLFLADAVAIASGAPIVPGERVARGAVLLLVGEDSRRDVEARIAAICQRHGVAPAALGDRLRVVYQTEVDPVGYTLARMEGDLAALNARMFRWLKSFPDVAAIFIDPLSAWSHVLENSNDALRVLLLGLRNLAASTRAAVAFDHHINKVSMADDPETHVRNLAAIRGGTYIAADMRWGFTMARVNARTAEAHGIASDERRLYRRLDYLKASYGPDGDGDAPHALFRIESVRIANGEEVGVLVPVDVAALRVAGEERREAKRLEFRDGLAVSLATMLDKEGPKSINAAAEWLAGHASNLYVNARGEPLSARSIRTKLAADVADGIVEPTSNGARGRRIATAPSDGRGRDGRVIVFAEAGAPDTSRRKARA